MARWWNRIFATDDSVAALVLRVTLGAVMFPHGAQKLLGWWGGQGLQGTFATFEQAFGIPPWLTAVVVAVEFFGGLALILGLAGRVCALAIGVNMVVAVALVHAGQGFFMNWTGQKPGEGFEYHLLAIADAAAVVLLGSGAWSLDRALARPAAPAVEPGPAARRPDYAGAR